MGIGHGGAGSTVFIVGQKPANIITNSIPFVITPRVGVEHGGHGSPARIAGEDMLFLFCGLPSFSFEKFEELDGVKIAFGFVP